MGVFELSKLYEICVSGIFPEIVWRVMIGRQATYLFCVNFGFWKKNRLAIHRLRVICAPVLLSV